MINTICHTTTRYFSAFYSHEHSLHLKPCDPKAYEHLLQKTQNVAFQRLLPAANPYLPGIVSARTIFKGISLCGEELVFIKAHTGKRNMIRIPNAHFEQLAFMISDGLDLNAVPITMSTGGYMDIAKKIQLSSIHFGPGVVLQEVVPHHPNQFHLKNKTPQQKEVLPKQISNVIFFNIITGRIDAEERNTVVDTSNNLKEVDNEHIGKEKTTSWLFTFFGDQVISPEAIEDFLKKDVHSLEKVFSNFEERFGVLQFFDQQELKYTTAPYKENITSNFMKLQKYLVLNKGSQITVKDLAKLFC